MDSSPGAFGKFSASLIAYLRALPFFASSNAAVLVVLFIVLNIAVISIAKIQKTNVTSKFVSKKSLHPYLWYLRLPKTIFDPLKAMQ